MNGQVLSSQQEEQMKVKKQEFDKEAKARIEKKIAAIEKESKALDENLKSRERRRELGNFTVRLLAAHSYAQNRMNEKSWKEDIKHAMYGAEILQKELDEREARG